MLKGQYYLTEENQCSIKFLKDILSERKRQFNQIWTLAYKIKDIKSIVVTQFEELSFKIMYSKIKGILSPNHW